MSFEPQLAAAGTLVGFLVGLTGMGGGALLTPLLVLVFGVPPLTAVSSDLVTSLVMKPFAGAVHLRRGTVHLRLFAWLAVGSVPAAFLASAAIGRLATGPSATQVAATLKVGIAVALLASVAAMIGRPLLDRARRSAVGTPTGAGVGDVGTTGGDAVAPLPVRRLRTVGIGVVGGIAVGLTSVGAGSLVIALLLLAYPTLRTRALIGTDIVQAIPLVGAAALGHLLFGDVHFALTGSLLVGAIPGAILGARLSAGAPDGLVRPAMTAVLAASALALLGASTPVLIGGALVSALLIVSATTRVGGRALRPAALHPPALHTAAPPAGLAEPLAATPAARD
jgi:uncharacterized membrane protein YfcA